MSKGPETTSGFDPGDDQTVSKILHKWDGGPLGSDLFTEIARIIPQPIIEVVILREREGRIETLLLPRPDGDPIWPGMVHTPGVAFRRSDFQASDEDPTNSAFKRVRNEIGNDFIAKPKLVGVSNHMSERGPAASQVYIAQISDDAVLSVGKFWHPVDDLPNLPNFIMHQLPFIRDAALHFAQTLRDSQAE